MEDANWYCFAVDTELASLAVSATAVNDRDTTVGRDITDRIGADSSSNTSAVFRLKCEQMLAQSAAEKLM